MEEFIQCFAGDDFHQASEDIHSEAVSPTITWIESFQLSGTIASARTVRLHPSTVNVSKNFFAAFARFPLRPCGKKLLTAKNSAKFAKGIVATTETKASADGL